MKVEFAGLNIIPFTEAPNAGKTGINLALSGASASILLPRVRGGTKRVIPFNEPGAPTVALAGAGAGLCTNGDHKALVTFVTAAGETPAGTKSATVTVANNAVNGKIAITNIPTGPVDIVIARKVYLTKATDPGGTAYLAQTISDNTTTSIPALSLADGALGAAAPSIDTSVPAQRLLKPRRIVCVADIAWSYRLGPTSPTAVVTDKEIPAFANAFIDVRKADLYLAAIATDGASTGDLNIAYESLLTSTP